MDMSLSKLLKLVMEQEALHVVVHGVSEWTELKVVNHNKYSNLEEF